MPMAEVQRTSLFERHQAAGARFVEFGGWTMPVQYRGLLAEHEAVRERAGLFDVSHMGEIEVEGEGALALCQGLTTNDASTIPVGRAQYTIWCTETGGTIDDTILYRVGEDRYLFCVNASNRSACWEWIRERADSAQGVRVRDRSAETALLALQGPAASGIVADAAGAWMADLRRFGCAEGELFGVDVFAARTGYTGEDGFELFCPDSEVGGLWDQLLRAGSARGLEPAGLGARDTLRLEAGLALYGHELGPEISPLEAGLGWAVKLDAEPFVGRDALATERAEGSRRTLIGLEITGRGIARAEYPVLADGRPVGVVTSGTKSPTLGKAIALALVDTEWVDATLSVEVRGRQVSAARVELPFYRRPR